MKKNKLTDYIAEDFPSDLQKDPFEHIIHKCMDFFKADYCSYLAPNFSEYIWPIKTRMASTGEKIVPLDRELYVESEYTQKSEEYNDTEIWSEIKDGICNVALCLKQAVFVADVNNTEYQYIKQFDDVKHEIAIPLLREDEATEVVIGCIILDFCNRSPYETSENEIKKQKNIERDLGNFVNNKIYQKASKNWERANLEISKLRKIDFDSSDDMKKVDAILSTLWPDLKYYSVWISNTRKTISDRGKSFVRIGSVFTDPEKRENYFQQDENIEYTFSENDVTTYGELLRNSVSHDDDKNPVVAQRKTFLSSDYDPINSEFKKFLYPDEDTKLDLHFIPLIEKEGKNGKEVVIISSVFVFFFEDLGDSHVIKPEALEQISRLIYDRIRFSRYIKVRELLSAIQGYSTLLFDNLQAFIKRLETDLLNVFPSQAVTIWLIKSNGIMSFFKQKTHKKVSENAVDERSYEYIAEKCLKESLSNLRTSHFHDSRTASKICQGCPVEKHIHIKWKSCMVIHILGPKDTPRAILFLFNRINPSLNNKIQAFSVLDQNAVKDIAGFLGSLLSLNETREAERRLRAIVPHEFASPASSLSHKLKDIEKIISDLLKSCSAHKKYPEKTTRLEKKIADSWLACEAMSHNSSNYIRFIKRKKNIYPETLCLYDVIFQMMHLFSGKFHEAKQIYIVIEGFSRYQFLHCDKAMLFSTLHNLFDNAYKYSHRYTVYHINAEETNTDITMTFTNYGIGIKPEELRSVFNLYYQSENVKKQTDSDIYRSNGIGLSLAGWYMKDCHNAEIYFRKSEKVADYNPFFLYIVKNIIGGEKIFNEAYKNNEKMKSARVSDKIASFFSDKDVMDFFKKVKPLGSLGEFLFQHMLELETCENELVLKIPKKIRR